MLRAGAFYTLLELTLTTNLLIFLVGSIKDVRIGIKNCRRRNIGG